MAGRREWGQAAAYTSSQSFRGDRAEQENKSLGVRKSGSDEGVRPGVIKAAGKGSVQPSARGIKGLNVDTKDAGAAYSGAAL